MNIRSVLEKMIAARASDLHLKAGTPPVVRVDGVLYTLDEPAPSSQELREVYQQMMGRTLHLPWLYEGWADAIRHAAPKLEITSMEWWHLPYYPHKEGTDLLFKRVAGHNRYLESLFLRHFFLQVSKHLKVGKQSFRLS